ncbi:arginyltransferase [Limibaculum sp. M0105]|uniref:Aspartate/glutamate leucyltransferase n=1 Tax=Thermohalobaculum xanthum TaxID=2753746 RepID=A0A8J7M5V7_9RHOB|nr:arginyltransferase [Thermohalobaculum xanthum]MBK0398924.1 arginyltransferase [Thermohalobaculum xanthum]
MSHHESALKAQFYLTAPQPCAYLSGREERKVFTTLQGTNAVAVNNALSLRGFRRSQSVIYRPACVGCSACMSIRIPVDAFRPSRAQRRTISRNADLERRTCEAWATETQFRLFRRYLDSRHADGGMADMDAFDYASMVDETPVNSTVVEYCRPDPASGATSLLAACLSDILADGLSMVYSFFEPGETARSLGSYMILDHINLAREMGLPFVYLGYWVSESPKMHYKVGYRPFELCDGTNWRRFPSVDEFRTWRAARFTASRDPLVD